MYVCMCVCVCIYIYIYTINKCCYIYNLLYKDQLHVSALDNGHLQVEIEKFSNHLYSTYVGCIQWGGKR